MTIISKHLFCCCITCFHISLRKHNPIPKFCKPKPYWGNVYGITLIENTFDKNVFIKGIISYCKAIAIFEKVYWLWYELSRGFRLTVLIIFCRSGKFTWLLYKYDRTRARMILNATGLSFRSSTKLSRSWIAIFEKQLIIENDSNFAAGVPISSAICEKVALNSLLPTELITFENTNKNSRN